MTYRRGTAAPSQMGFPFRNISRFLSLSDSIRVCRHVVDTTATVTVWSPRSHTHTQPAHLQPIRPVPTSRERKKHPAPVFKILSSAENARVRRAPIGGHRIWTTSHTRTHRIAARALTPHPFMGGMRWSLRCDRYATTVA